LSAHPYQTPGSGAEHHLAPIAESAGPAL